MIRRVVAVVVVVTGAAVAVAAIDAGRIVATPSAGVVVTGSAGSLALQNPSPSATVTLAQIARIGCGPAPAGTLVGSAVLAPGDTRTFAIGCGSGSAIARCLFQASDTDGAFLGQWMAVCEAGTAATLSTDAGSALDLGTVAMGTSATRTLMLLNNGSAAIDTLHLQLDDLTGNFTLAAPCNPDGAYCDASTSIAPGSGAPVTIACTPRTAGTLTAHLHAVSDQRSYLPPLALTCTGTAATAPLIDISPTALELGAVAVQGGTASATVHVANAGSGTLMITEVRVDDVDAGASSDWHYVASGVCAGAIPPACALAPGDAIDLAVTFDPSALFLRRASLTIDYVDTAAKSASVQLGGTGDGATLELDDLPSPLDLGSVPVNATSSVSLQLANRGTRGTTAMLGTMPAGTPLSVAPSPTVPVAPTLPASITVRCAPTAPGMFDATIAAAGSDTLTTQPITIDARCEGSTLPIAASPTTLQLGEIRKGAGAVHTIAIASTAMGQVALAGAPMLETPNTNLMLGALSAQTTPATFTLTIDPQHEGSLSNHILIQTEGGDTLRIPVNGNVVSASYAAPAALDLGTFCVGLPTSSSNVTLSSTGTGVLALPMQPALAKGAASPFRILATAPTLYPASLRPDASATVAIAPERQAAVATETDDLTWHTDLDDFTTTVSATFTDTGGAIAPGALSFAPVPIHLVTDNGQRVTIQNCSSSPLALQAMIKAPFVLDSPFPATLRPAETQTFSVAFHPTQKGMFSDDLTITSPQLPDVLKVHLTGEGIVEAQPDGGGITNPEHSTGSFYGCADCSSGGSAPVWLVVLALSVRRRRGSS